MADLLDLPLAAVEVVGLPAEAEEAVVLQRPGAAAVGEDQCLPAVVVVVEVHPSCPAAEGVAEVHRHPSPLPVGVEVVVVAVPRLAVVVEEVVVRTAAAEPPDCVCGIQP